VLSLSREEIQLDLEIDLAMREDAHPQQCAQCGGWTWFKHCPLCPGRPPISPVEQLAERETSGEGVPWEEYTRLFGGDVKR
jgi:hypothetical protein